MTAQELTETNITEEMLDGLRSDIKERLSERRLLHTLAVEEMAARIGGIYSPERVNILRASALLHDITKERGADEQLAIFEKHGVTVPDDIKYSPSTHHAITAALEIPELFPHLANREVISAVRYHTTGRADMTLCEKIIYLSDYIDMTRTYPDCVMLREMFWSAKPDEMTESERMEHLDRVILRSFEVTICDLIKRNKTISRETADALEFIQKKYEKQKTEVR